MKEQGFIQIGVTAARDPITGKYLPPVPLYIEGDDSATASAENLERDIGRLLADRMRRYIEECRSLGIEFPPENE